MEMKPLNYLENLNPTIDNLKQFKEEALALNIPIMEEDGLQLFAQALLLSKAKEVLEIGTAIGYSAIYLALHTPVHITSIERDEERYLLARQNVKKFQLEDRITLLLGDALELTETSLPNVDAIFIDAAKAQYQKFFEKYQVLLNQGGFILSDNLLFHQVVLHPEEAQSRNVRQLVRKIDHYNHWLSTLETYQTSFYDIADGIAISIKK